MKTLHYLLDPNLAGLYWPGVLTGLAIAALCALLSVLVVLKRLAFIGQGVSHAAFGGVGIAAMLGIAGAAGVGAAAGQFGVVFAFCLGAAILIGWLSRRRGGASTEADTAIGIVLVASMALGAILIKLSRSGVAWETFLFGSIAVVSWTDAAIGWGAAAGVLAALWLARRHLVFWAFDEHAAEAFGVRGGRMNLLLMVLLALATVTAMKLAGVVLATAMLVLPGAIALKLSPRSGSVIVLAALAALVGVAGGMVLSFELDWLTGPSIVLVLAALFAAARVRESVLA